MFSGPPLPLPPDLPLRQLLLLLNSRLGAGVWFRGATRPCWLATGPGRCSPVLFAGDLGLLLRRCARVVVRDGTRAVLLKSELLIRWRVLQVVTGTPFLSCHRLKEIFPESEMDDLGFRVPTRSCPPEVVLAQCLTHEIPVAETRIIYRPPGQRSSG